MTLPPAETLAARLMAEHQRFFAENPNGELATQALVVAPDGQGAILPMPFRDAAEKALFIEILRMTIARISAPRYAIWGEAWMAVGVPEERIAEVGSIAALPPAEREEVVYTLVADIDRVTPLFRWQRIERGRRGGVRRLVEVERNDGDSMGGGMADLFPRPKGRPQ